MPELPEVETIARGLDKRVRGDVIESIWLGSKPEPLKSSAFEIARTVENSLIVGVRRMGKHIVVDLEHCVGRSSRRRLHKSREKPGDNTRAQWIIHLGMSGRVQVCPPDAELLKHTHAIAKLASGRELRFVDPRRFGRLSVSQNGEFEAGGSEPLDVELDKFIDLFRGRATPIKSALLNQKLLRGVGNIYADESLWSAQIHPARSGARLKEKELERLRKALQRILRKAIQMRGSSISDFVDVEGKQGDYQQRHQAYGREGKKCFRCGCVIKRIIVAGRSSYLCPRCQRSPRHQGRTRKKTKRTGLVRTS